MEHRELKVSGMVMRSMSKRRIVKGLMVLVFGLLSISVSAGCWYSKKQPEAQVAGDILQAGHRTPEFVLRDQYRHPLETLAFFEVNQGMTVVEIWPGKGWYTEILAPYLGVGEDDDESAGESTSEDVGAFYAAHFPTGVGVEYFDTQQALFVQKLAEQPDVYKGVQLAVFDPSRNQLTVPEESADRVLTFRNVHNWLRTESESNAFELFYKALKPGGLLGVVEHRALEGTDWETMKTSGYMTEQYVIELAEKAGFVLEGKCRSTATRKTQKTIPKGFGHCRLHCG